MSKLRDQVSKYKEELREGIEWIVFWKEGRSWESTHFITELDDEANEFLLPEDIAELEAIQKKDPQAIALNGEYSGFVGADLTIAQLEAGVRWQYENAGYRIGNFIEEMRQDLTMKHVIKAIEQEQQQELKEVETKQTNALAVIQQQEILGKQLTLYGDCENPLFLAKEVAQWIDYDVSSINKMLNNVDDDEKTTRTIIPNGSNYQTQAWFLTEDGVYEVLMQSRKPIAKQFKKEVKAVLKSIRKHGAYMTPEMLQHVLTSPDVITTLAAALAKNLKSGMLEKTEIKTIFVMDKQIQEQREKGLTYYDVVAQQKEPIALSRIAKDYFLNTNELKQLLAEKGLIVLLGGAWLLHKDYEREKGDQYARYKTHRYITKSGVEHTTRVLSWTQRGRLLIYHLLKEDNILPAIEREYM